MMLSNIKHVLLLILLTLPLGIKNVSAESRMMDKKLQQAYTSGKLSGLHSVLVIHKGKIIAESYFPGKDEKWGIPLGEIQHNHNTLHDLRSATKSIVSLLYGIALAEGKVPALDEKILKQFPQYSDLSQNTLRNSITIRHTLTMKMGTEWNEQLPYTNPNNSEIAMEQAEDRFRYILNRPMVKEPGNFWVYNGGATALIAKLITDGVGMPIDQYAQKKLFTPLGIQKFEWVRGKDGVPAAASGLRLNIHDLAKIGKLILQNGEYDNRQIIPEEWLKESFTPRARLDPHVSYGYFWWLSSQGTPPIWMAASGNGGQRLTIQPGHDLIICTFAGNYNQPDGWILPIKIIEEFIAPTLRETANNK